MGDTEEVEVLVADRHLNGHGIDVRDKSESEMPRIGIGVDHLAEPVGVHDGDGNGFGPCPLLSCWMHPLLTVLLAAARGHFPPVDGGVTMHAPLEDGREAVVSFTGHAHIASRLRWADVADLAPDGFGRASYPRLLLRMAAAGPVGTHDVTLVTESLGGGTLQRRTDLDEHPRVRHARSIRSDVEVYGDDRGLITVSTGLAGRTEIGVEASEPGAGGRSLIIDALRLVERGTSVFAAVSPGNARSLRAFLGCGFTPIASEVLVTPDLRR